MQYDFSCPNITDRFSTEYEKARLKYKVGLLSIADGKISQVDVLLKSASIPSYWLSSPESLSVSNSIFPYGTVVELPNYSWVKGISEKYGVRPSISLLPGTEYISGEGSMKNPYIIDMKKEN